MAKKNIFWRRAEPEEVEKESKEEEILAAELSDDYIGFEEAMKVPAFSGCVNLIADTIAMIPIKLYKRENGKVQEAEDDTRVILLNRDTGDSLDGVQFKKAMVRDYFGKGGYAYINRVGNDVKSLHYVENGYIACQFNSDPIFKEYEITVNGRKYQPYQFLKVLRNSKNGRDSTSIVEENREILSVAYASLKFEKSLVKTGGNKKGFITSAKKITDAAMKSLKAAWKRLYSSSTENVVILQDGMQFKESSNTSVEMQINENKKANSDEICKIFHMVPEMIKGGAKEEDKINFIQYAINPILAEIECACNRDLLLEKEKKSYFFAADTSDLTKGDIEKRFTAYEKAVKNGWLQIDEVRYKENMEPLGLKFVKLGLQDVIYYPENGTFYVPNTNKTGEKGTGEENEN